VCFAVAFALPKVAALTSRKTVHAIALLCGSVGLLSIWAIREPWLLVLSMCGVGIAWASILAMPYAILAGSLPPARMGVYMGVFNFFIVLPEILQALTFGPLIRTFFGTDPNAPVYIVLIGGVCLAIAALLVSRVHDASAQPAQEQRQAA
jgi:maltose/moltooligosaccharide transporter